MRLLKILVGSITGTFMMTAFSYFISEKKRKQFKEPVLLNFLLGKVKSSDLKVNEGNPAGYIIHYTVGLFFTILYDQIWQRTKLKPTIQNGLMLGGINGFIAVVVWHTTFKLHPRPPLIDHKSYYGHLIITHFVFGAFTVAGYRLPEISDIKNR
jgi:hypothetical protein